MMPSGEPRPPKPWPSTVPLAAASGPRMQPLGAHSQPSSPRQAGGRTQPREADVLLAVVDEVAANLSKCLPRLPDGYDAFSLTS